MVDGFDFDLGLDGFGVDGFGFDTVGFDSLGFGFGGFDGLAGFDPMTATFDGMGMQDFGGFDVNGMDMTGLELDLGFDTLGFGSDLEDVILAPEMSQLIDLDLAGPLDGGMTLDDALNLGPQSVSGLSPSAAMGPGPFGSPFLSVDGGGVAMGGGVAAAGFGTGALLPGDVLNAPTDGFRFPARSTGRVVAKVSAWLAGKSRELAEGLAMEAVADQVKRGARTVFANIRGAERATV